MPADFEGDVDQHPAGRRIDSFRLGEAVVTQQGEEPIHLTVIEFLYEGELVDGVGLHPSLASELGAALVATRQ